MQENLKLGFYCKIWNLLFKKNILNTFYELQNRYVWQKQQVHTAVKLTDFTADFTAGFAWNYNYPLNKNIYIKSDDNNKTDKKQNRLPNKTMYNMVIMFTQIQGTFQLRY